MGDEAGFGSNHRLDLLDVKILRGLLTDEPYLRVQSDIRKSYGEIAKKLSVSEDTVRERIGGFYRSGFIRGWRLGINPTLFGWKTSYLFFDVQSPAEKVRTIKRLMDVRGVLWIADHLDGYVGVLISFADEEALERNLGPVSYILSSRGFVRTNNQFPEVRMRLTDTDWRIIDSLRKEPRKHLGKTARELKVSPRTVKRRLQRMIQERAFFVFPDLDLRKLEGSVLTTLAVFYLDKKFRRAVEDEIMSRYGDYYVFNTPTQPEYGAYAFILPSLSLAEDLRDSVSALPGVKSASNRHHAAIYNLLEEAFDEELQRKIPIPQEIRV
jgi:DNA-binding Lrp family transcriptional regulator